ncbi:hypothetical protein ACROYT_G014130 [Oculina patagonica]
MASEEGTLLNEMSVQLFSRCKVDELKTFLKKGGVVISGRKAELAEKAYFAWKLKLDVSKTTREEENDVSTRRRKKLTMESGITLPFPDSIQEGWEEGSLNFPDLIDDGVQQYMQPSTKAMKQGMSLLDSGHIHSVNYHHISIDLKYCFIHCRCVPEEKTNSDPFALSVCLHKENGKVLTAECSCFAGRRDKAVNQAIRTSRSTSNDEIAHFRSTILPIPIREVEEPEWIWI